jgi:hypothetical protein
MQQVSSSHCIRETFFIRETMLVGPFYKASTSASINSSIMNNISTWTSQKGAEVEGRASTSASRPPNRSLVGVSSVLQLTRLHRPIHGSSTQNTRCHSYSCISGVPPVPRSEPSRVSASEDLTGTAGRDKMRQSQAQSNESVLGHLSGLWCRAE